MGLFNRKKNVDDKVYKDYQDVRKNAPVKLNRIVTTENGKKYKCTKLNVVPVWTAVED